MKGERVLNLGLLLAFKRLSFIIIEKKNIGGPRVCYGQERIQCKFEGGAAGSGGAEKFSEISDK